MTISEEYDFDYMQPQTDWEPADDIMAALKTIPGIEERSQERAAAYEQMEREYRMGLADLRSALALTQTEVAEKMGIKQSTLSRIEARPDILISSLRGYLNAIGAKATLTIRVGQTEISTDLDHLLPA